VVRQRIADRQPHVVFIKRGRDEPLREGEHFRRPEGRHDMTIRRQQRSPHPQVVAKQRVAGGPNDAQPREERCRIADLGKATKKGR